MAKIKLPRYLRAKKLSGGSTAYFWERPSWAKPPAEKYGRRCPVDSEALGQDLAAAIGKADLLNAALDEWRLGVAGKPAEGTVQALFAWYRNHDRFKEASFRTRRDYREKMDIVENVQLKTTLFGQRRAAEAAGLPVVILDSFSHAWEGVGGVLDTQAQVLDRLVEQAQKRANGRYEVDPSKFGQLAWAEVKPKYRRLIDRIVRAKTNIIICTRAKPVMQKGFGDKAENARVTKTRRKDVPWDPASDGDLMFEMTAMVILDPAAPGCPVHQIKVSDQFKNLFDPRRPMGEATGAAMAEWAKGEGEAQKEKEVMDFARDKARQGKVKFTEWWNSDDGKASRSIIRPIMDDITALCAQADQDAARSDDDPFGEGPADSQRGEAFTGTEGLSEDELAAKVREETNSMAAAA